MQTAITLTDLTSSVKKGFVYAKKGEEVKVIKAEGDLYLIQTQTSKIYTLKENIKIKK